MIIAIIGAGAIGSVVAAKLSKAGEDVVLVGRADQVAAINAHGLTIKSADGDEHFKVKALTKLDQEYDLVIFCQSTEIIIVYIIFTLTMGNGDTQDLTIA